MGVVSIWEKKVAALKKTKDLEIEVVELTPKEIEKIRKQVVESTLTEKSEKVVPDAFLSAQTQTVQKQTRAKEVSAFKEGKKASGQEKNENQKLSLNKLGVPMNFKPLGNLGPPGTISNTPSATNDYLKDIKEGAQTLLNTKEFVYFSFYQRVRKQLEQFWEPGLREKLLKMYEQGRNLATDREHSTRLLVVLNAEGVITKILVPNTSGLAELDQAAIEAFNKAGPFPNPPKGMVEVDGTVKVEWEFILKT